MEAPWWRRKATPEYFVKQFTEVCAGLHAHSARVRPRHQRHSNASVFMFGS